MKARDLDPEIRLAGGRARVADGTAWGELWRQHQDWYFREHGLEVRVDARAPHAQEHMGPVRMRRAGSDILERAETIRQANEAAARDPDQVLAALTRNNATFSGRDLDRYLEKHVDAAEERAAIKAKISEHRDLVVLYDRETGESAGRFTTRQVREEEQKALFKASLMARHRIGAVSTRSTEAALAERSLRPDQQAAFMHATGAGALKLIEGRAGTGKSYTLAAIRDAHERDGKHVIGLAPTNAVAQSLAADGFTDTATVHSALFRLKNGRTSWDRNTVVVVDEAAMLDTRVTGELLAVARSSGAKLILAGDDRQLASIERGGLFTELRQRHGAAAITEVTRQKVDWQRQAARDLAEGRFVEAVGAFDRAGAITWTATQGAARKVLVAPRTRDAEAHPGASRFVFAYTNRDVDALNAELRNVRRRRGELTGADVGFETRHGPAGFAVGDRVQFTDTDRKLRIYNGNTGTITAIDERTGRITARLDAAGKEGREVTWSAREFQGFRHGYAGTIYKGQGKPLDRTYLYHTEHWRSAASYVALTRQRESAQVFVARETARDVGQLARQMGRGEVRSASVAWATREEIARAPEREAAQADVQRATPQPVPDRSRLTPRVPEWGLSDSLKTKVHAASEARQREADGSAATGREAERGVQHPAQFQDRAESSWRQLEGRVGQSEQDSLRDKVRGASEARQHQAELPEPEWLIPPHVSRDGRDSLGRGLDPASIAAAVAADPEVQKAKAGPARWLEDAYRDPGKAFTRLEELIKAEGWIGAAERVLRKPERLGRLLGRDGLFASRSAQEQRNYALSATRSLSYNLTRIAYMESSAEQSYRDDVMAQLEHDKVGIPKLSPQASAFLQSVQAVRTKTPGESWYAADSRDQAAVAKAWGKGRRNPAIAAEIDRFEQAVELRLGRNGTAVAIQSAREGTLLTLPGIQPEHRQVMTQLARQFSTPGWDASITSSSSMTRPGSGHSASVSMSAGWGGDWSDRVRM